MAFMDDFAPLQDPTPPNPLAAMAARTLLIHAYRRVALKDPRLPASLLPTLWPGHQARQLCRATYAALIPQAEQWLDETTNGSGPLPQGPDPSTRFT